MTSCVVCYDIIYHPLPINSQCLKTWGGGGGIWQPWSGGNTLAQQKVVGERRGYGHVSVRHLTHSLLGILSKKKNVSWSYSSLLVNVWLERAKTTHKPIDEPSAKCNLLFLIQIINFCSLGMHRKQNPLLLFWWWCHKWSIEGIWICMGWYGRFSGEWVYNPNE